jgi:hypothetical protein
MKRTHVSPSWAADATSPVIQPQNVRAARYMVSNHGTAAAEVAKKRAANLMACGKLDSAATWLEIARAIHDLDTPRSLS